MTNKSILIKRFNGNKPSIAYTDFCKIYISNNITKEDEYNLLCKHEFSHIWLQHKFRREIIEKEENEEFNFDAWVVACDLELALHMYSEEDDKLINSPRSFLNFGITKKDAKEFPNCKYAEEFYKELKNQPNFSSKYQSHDGNANETAKNKNQSEENNNQQSDKPIKDLESIVNKAKELVDDLLRELKKQQSEKSFSENIKQFRPRPSLASEIDSYLKYSALDRVESYRRPDRRESDFFSKGRISKQKTAKVIIYLDRSASFCADKTAKAHTVLNNILQKYRTKIERDVIFFHDSLFFAEPKSQGGTNYLAVAKDIAERNPKLAIIITDDDSCDTECSIILSKFSNNILVLPIGCSKTQMATIFKAKEFLI